MKANAGAGPAPCGGKGLMWRWLLRFLRELLREPNWKGYGGSERRGQEE